MLPQAFLVPFEDGEPIRLTKLLTVIGRKRGVCDICLTSARVSRVHCVILKSERGVFVEDVGSRNGTEVNGQRVRQSMLADEDVLAVGDEHFRVHVAGLDQTIGGSESAAEIEFLKRLANEDDAPPSDCSHKQTDAGINARTVMIQELFDDDTGQVAEVSAQAERAASGNKSHVCPRLPPPTKRGGSSTPPCTTANAHDSVRTGPAHSQEGLPSPPENSRTRLHTVVRSGDGWTQSAISVIQRMRNNRKWIAVAAVGLCLLLVALWPAQATDEEIYQAFASIWDELKDKRTKRAGQNEWNEFQTRVTPQLDQLVRELERTANSQRRARQELLWAGRDYLRNMRFDARTAGSKSEEMFAKHMENARKLLSGEQLLPAPGT